MENPKRMTVSAAIAAARTQLGYPAHVPPVQGTLVALFETAVKQFAEKPAFTCLGHTITYAELDRLSMAFAAWLQRQTDLLPGERIALQLPNCLQFPVAFYGALRAGLVVVCTNPLYTTAEMEHQFNDAGVRAVLVLANMASKVEAVLPATAVRHVIVTDIADLHPLSKRWLINGVVRYFKHDVPAYDLPNAHRFNHILQAGQQWRCEPVQCDPHDTALLQYTGGTTGVAKGAMLSHANLLSNRQQCQPFLVRAGLVDGMEIAIAPLPLYHVYALMLHVITLLSHGQHTVLVPNPRDLDGFIRLLQRQSFTVFVGLNTLFNGLLARTGFSRVDVSRLKLTLSGGMALTDVTARHWQSTTGCHITEGYGLTESSPVLTLNPPEAVRVGSIGIPLPDTDIRILSDNGAEQLSGEPGELCARGPQVMQGYWHRPEATAETVVNGWLHTGDIAVVEPDGYLRIVDRKKDMVIVSGFNVYPNEIENVMAACPGVLECAVIGVPDDVTGEAVKLFVVPREASLDLDAVREYARSKLTGYKVPKHIEFRDSLPKTNVGKVLRRALRDDAGK